MSLSLRARFGTACCFFGIALLASPGSAQSDDASADSSAASGEEESAPTWLPPELSAQPASNEDEFSVQEDESSGVLTLEELVNPLVTTASQRSESTRAAPAWIISLSGEELRERGYLELTDLLDDLPSMDVVRPWGDAYVRSYWRGYRHGVGSPFLLMVDGLIFNHLWLNESQIMAAIPLSNIDRVEVVYGPASAVYGPNAAMGVINVITRTPKENAYGVSGHADFTLRMPQTSLLNLQQDHLTKVGDLGLVYQGDGFSMRASARLEHGVFDPAAMERFEWTKSQYFKDRSLWGEFLDYPGIAGVPESINEKQAVDFRVTFGTTEVGAQLYRMSTGSGLTYPADKLHVRQNYTLQETSTFLRHRQDLGSTMQSTTLLRYRESNVEPPSTGVERDNAANAVSFQYWQSKSSSFILRQDFAALAGENLLFSPDAWLIDFGGKYERRDLQKSYVINGIDSWLPVDQSLEQSGYRFPDPVSGGRRLDNRGILDVAGLYLLSKYRMFQDHSIDFGARLDYNSLLSQLYVTFRGGYVGRFFDSLTLKLLYGQALQEPTWRNLFGAWSGTGSNPGLRPERSQTFELGAQYTLAAPFSKDWLDLYATTYAIHYSDAFPATEDLSDNIGDRFISGADLGATALLPVPFIRQLRLWAYYSAYFFAGEGAGESSIFKWRGLIDDDTAFFNRERIGDLATHKFWGGVSAQLNRWVGLTGLGRCVSARTPVTTNPLGDVPGYCVVDANLRLRDLLVDGFSVSFRVTNLLDAKFDHPGLLDAAVPSTPGVWQDGTWNGSGDSYFNSRLPQPGRAFMLRTALAF